LILLAVVIRQALRKDAPRLAQINHAAWAAAYPRILSAALLARQLEADAMTRTAAMWMRRLSHPSADQGMTSLVAEDQGLVIGWIRVGPAEAPEHSMGEVHGIYVDPEWWGEGVGRSLMEAGHEVLRSSGFSKAILWVLEGNDRAKRFYEHLGWSWDGTLRMTKFDGELAKEVKYARQLPSSN